VNLNVLAIGDVDPLRVRIYAAHEGSPVGINNGQLHDRAWQVEVPDALEQLALSPLRRECRSEVGQESINRIGGSLEIRQKQPRYLFSIRRCVVLDLTVHLPKRVDADEYNANAECRPYADSD